MATLTYLLDVSAPNAARTFDGVRARLTDLDKSLQKTRELTVGDKQAMATFVRLQAQADRFKDKLSNMPLSLEGAAKAEATLLTLEASADRLDSKLSGGSSTRKNIWSWISAGIPSLITSFGNLGTGFTGFIASMAATGPIGIGVLAALAAAAAGLAAVLSTVAAAFIPITIGFGAFAALAIPQITKVWKAVSAGGKAWRDLTPAQKAVGDQIKGLQSQFGKLSKSIQPEVLTAFSDGLKIIKQLMPALRPLLDAAGKAIDTFLKSMSNWLKSPSGQGFIRWLQTDGPKDIKIFGQVMWDTAVFIGTALDHIYRTGVWLEGHLRTIFTTDIPASLTILKESVRVAFDWIQVKAADLVLAVTTTFGHLPGPLGAPFRSASTAVRNFRDSAIKDMNAAEQAIQGAIDRLHGKTVALTFGLNLPKGVSYPSRPIKGRGARGIHGAAAGTWLVGEEGPELAYLPQGTHVMPAAPTRRIMGGLAGGTLDTFSLRTPTTAQIAAIAQVQGIINLIAQAVKGNIGTISIPGVTGGGRTSAGGPFNLGMLESLWQQAGGPGGYIAHIAGAIALAESGGSPIARNPSGASGLWQILGQVVPGNIFNPFVNALNAVSKFDSARGFSPWVTYETGAYRAFMDRGGWLMPGKTVVTNNTGRPERVLPPGATGQPVQVNVNISAAGADRALLEWLRNAVTVEGGGSVQVALGSRY